MKMGLLTASHEILTNEIAGKASPANALNHIMHEVKHAIKHIWNPLECFNVRHLGGANKG